MWRLNEERGTTVLEGGHIALFLLNMVFGLSLSRAGSGVSSEGGVPRRAIAFYYVPADWGPRNWTSKRRARGREKPALRRRFCHLAQAPCFTQGSLQRKQRVCESAMGKP